MCQSPVAPHRIELKPNLHYGRQDTASSDVRTSFDHSGKHKENCDGGTYEETCRCEMDCRIQGLLHLAVREYDHIRKEAVQKWIHRFETHPNKEALKADFKTKSRDQPIQRAAWETWSTSRFARSLPKYNAPTVCRTGPNVLYIAHAEHAYDLQTKFENSTVTATMFCRFPITSSKRARRMEHFMVTRRVRESAMQPMSLLKRRRRRGSHQYWIDS